MIPRKSCVLTAILFVLFFVELDVSKVAADEYGSPTKSAKGQWEYLDNGQIRIGVNKSRGACIGFFGDSKTKRNVLNHYDRGRFIQQSYYGAATATIGMGSRGDTTPSKVGVGEGKTRECWSSTTARTMQTSMPRLNRGTGPTANFALRSSWSSGYLLRVL